MTLIKKPGSRYWQYQCSVNGKKWIRSTGCSNRAKAEEKVPRFKKLAELHREQPSDFLRLKNAIVREVDRLETEVSASEATRTDYALGNFFDFTGDILLEKVDEDMLKTYMRHRINQKASKMTNSGDSSAIAGKNIESSSCSCS